MPDAMTNGGFAPYLAQAFTPQGVAGGLFCQRRLNSDPVWCVSPIES
jgi:hypothetical protein